jgi:hypothetical protein
VPPGIWDLNGDWEGDWDGGGIGRGHVELSLRQVETRVEGELRIAGVPGISATDGPLAGRVRGDTFSFSQHTGVVEGDLRVSEGRMQGYTTGRLRMTLDLYRRAK